jgi:DNA-binding response OmpR family regulator
MQQRILIVDDEESIVFAMKRYFTAGGFQVDSARELEEAEALLVNARYGALIADLRLTGVHGAEGLDIIGYAHQHSPWTRTILLTAYGSPELEAEARSRGADVVLRKPQALPDLAQVIVALMQEVS